MGAAVKEVVGHYIGGQAVAGTSARFGDVFNPATGEVELLDYAVVEDCGTMVNPMLVAGQAHGAVTQGIGQALMEHAIYDGQGQLLSGSFMDYAMPRADNFPPFRIDFSEIPSASNPLGVKGVGEGGTTPAPAVIVSAIVDALKHTGIENIEMPVTSERIWRALTGS